LGKRLPWYADTSPKLLLAFIPDDMREELMTGDDFRQAIQAGRFTLDSLRQELREIREQGYYVGMRDRYDGGIAVSAPIFDHIRQVVGAINLAAPSQRMLGRTLERAIRRVVQEADAISHELGFRPEAAIAQANGRMKDYDLGTHLVDGSN
jgi:DNA-binding IclR family transcriptional regulator